MSDYVRKKALRIPAECCADTSIWNDDDFYDNLEEIIKKSMNPHNFDVEVTLDISDNIHYYIDYVIDGSYGEECGDWGKVRLLTDNEKVKYYPIFSEIIPDVTMDDVHLVEYCYYNCCEPSDYYSLEGELDPFYQEV